MSIRHNAQATCLFPLLIFLLSGYSNCGAAAPVSASTNDGVIEVRVIGQKPDPWTRYGTVVGPVIAWIGTVIAIVIGVRNTNKQIKTKFDEIEKSYANERTTKETEREERRDSLVAS